MSRPEPASNEGDLTSVSRLGRYRVVREIGRGSMGRVFLGIDPRIDRKVALKVLDPMSAQGLPHPDEMRRRFVAEARAAGRLNHPNIVTVYDAGLDPTTRLPYLAMEWVDGESLAEHLSRVPVSPQRAVEITRQIAEALDHAHRRGLVHRDVKPANILITDDGVAKLTDFGVAKFGDGDLQTTGGQVFGTPAYMSPEQIQGEKVDARSDLFSLGACLYELVTGQAPFRGERIADVAYRIVHTMPPVPDDLQIPGLESVLLEALAKSPADRFTSARAMIEALTASSPPAVADDSDPQRSRAAVDRRASASGLPRERRRLVWATLALGGLALTLLLVNLVSRRSDPDTGSLPDLANQTSSPRDRRASPPAGDAMPRTSARETTETSGSSGSSTAEAFLVLTHVNRLRQAALVVSVDGEVVWSDALEGSKNPLRRPWGSEVSTRIPVSPGKHEIAVRLRGGKGKLDEQARIEGSFRAGEERALKVVLSLPPGRSLRLRWE